MPIPKRNFKVQLTKSAVMIQSRTAYDAAKQASGEDVFYYSGSTYTQPWIFTADHHSTIKVWEDYDEI